ncbi:MAG: hypothetical protein AVDCRST_MAG59-4665, partial [uncultured Thermomicrobiales bacterium]
GRARVFEPRREDEETRKRSRRATVLALAARPRDLLVVTSPRLLVSSAL